MFWLLTVSSATATDARRPLACQSPDAAPLSGVDDGTSGRENSRCAEGECLNTRPLKGECAPDLPRLRIKGYQLLMVTAMIGPEHAQYLVALLAVAQLQTVRAWRWSVLPDVFACLERKAPDVPVVAIRSSFVPMVTARPI